MHKRYQQLVVFLILAITPPAHAQPNTTITHFYSTIVKDSFEIFASPVYRDPSKDTFDLVIYLDANLRSGIELRNQLNRHTEGREGHNNLFIGIGHLGNFHVLRRRDFILPFIHNMDTVPASAMYGHIKEFYAFVAYELIPYLEAHYQCSGRRSILGHSLGGLFVIYSLFQNEAIFENFVALSPALWIDRYRIFSFNKIKDSLQANSYLYLSVGGKEQFNQILTGANKLFRLLQVRHYRNLKFEYKVHPGRTHNSQVPVSLKEALLKF